MSDDKITLPLEISTRPTLGRKWVAYLLCLLDFGGALTIGLIVPQLLPTLPDYTYVVGLWLLAFTLIWLVTCDIDKNFRLSAYTTYSRVCKIAFWSAVGYLLFFVVTRFAYSLTFLLWVIILWLIWGTATRWTLRRLLPPTKGLTFEALSSSLATNTRLRWTTAQEATPYDISAFDFLLINYDKPYNHTTQTMLLHALTAGIPILSISQTIEHLTGKVSTESLQDFWTKTAFQVNLFYLRCKRLLDLFVTLALSPLLILLAIGISVLIRFSMGRPILFWQERIGRDSKPFKMVKFRTMVRNAEALGDRYTLSGDARVTLLGTFLRRLRLDELPQFYNILKGDMSLIGPRPEATTLVENFTKNIPLYQIRHWLKPGITGWAQVMHGYAAGEQGMIEKLQYDMFYLKNISLWIDLIIIYRTIVIILTGFGSR
jgi:lipopolysaccharide/colanic/teichoic acid biosynthesis glycosyltransferase